MRKGIIGFWALGLCFAQWVAGLRADVKAPDFVTKLAPVPPFSSLAATAQTNRISLNGIDAPREDVTLTAGDSIGALVTLYEKSRPHSQWLLFLEATEPNPKSKHASPAKPMVLYSSLGSRLEFESMPVPGKVRIIGPFDEPKLKGKPQAEHDISAKVRLDRGFLSLGLDRAATAARRLNAAGMKGAYSFKDSPYSSAEIGRSRKIMSGAMLTAEEEHAICGSVPAMLSYLEIAQRTKGLSNILLKMVELPSLWSMVVHGGVGTVNMRFQGERVLPAEPATWGLPAGTPVYYLPMALELDKHPALNLTFVVTSPRPPLLGSAGIVGLLAEKPDDPGTYLSLRVVSAHLAELQK